MTNDNRTSDEIERDIADERAQMSDSINNLQKKFSVDAIVGDVGAMLRTQGGDLGRAISHTVGRNPAAVALVGVGLAWLFLGQDRSSRASRERDDPWGDRERHAGNHSTHDTWDRQSAGRPAGDGPSDRDQFWYGNDQMARTRKAQGRSLSGDGQNRRTMSDASGGVSGSIQGAAHAVGDAMSDATSTVGQAASDLTARLSHGLEDFSEEARTRILAARRAAHEARVASTEAMKKGARVASNFFEDQPLVVGALAVAVGAAMGGVLPHSRIEDDTLGESSDRLFAEAQSLFWQERDKAMAAVRMAATDVKDEVRDVGDELADLLPEGKSVGNVIVDRAADAASRVYDRATGGVDHQGSGNGQG